MNACSLKQVTSIPGAMSPAAVKKKNEVLEISHETNPGLVVGVSLAIVIGASVLAAVVYVRLHKVADDKAKINDGRRSSSENNIMNQLYGANYTGQTGLMQFSQPEPGYLNHVIKNESNYHQLPNESNYPKYQLPAESNYPRVQLPNQLNYPNHQISNNYPRSEGNYPTHQLGGVSSNYSMHELPHRRASYTHHQISSSYPSAYPAHRLPTESNYPPHVLPGR